MPLNEGASHLRLVVDVSSHACGCGLCTYILRTLSLNAHIDHLCYHHNQSLLIALLICGSVQTFLTTEPDSKIQAKPRPKFYTSYVLLTKNPVLGTFLFPPLSALPPFLPALPLIQASLTDFALLTAFGASNLSPRDSETR